MVRTCQRSSSGAGPTRPPPKPVTDRVGSTSGAAIMSDAILVFNAGSSSIKFALFKTSDRGDPRLSCRGLLDEDQDDPRLVVTDAGGDILLERQRTQSDAAEGGLFGDVVEWAESQWKALAIIGHR